MDLSSKFDFLPCLPENIQLEKVKLQLQNIWNLTFRNMEMLVGSLGGANRNPMALPLIH